MLKLIFWLALLVLIVFASVWIADHPGDITIEWLGYIIEPTLGAMILAILVIVFLLYLLARSIDEMASIPKNLKRWQHVRKLEKGIEATNEGFLAIASGRERYALKQANKAHKLLDQPMTLMLKAQAAQLNGREKAAEEYFALMRNNEETAFIGTKNLLAKARKTGDVESYVLAKEAHQMQPQNEWVTRTLIHSQMEKGEWQEAHHTLLKDQRDHGLEKQERNHLLQLVLIERSRDCDDAKLALDHAHRAWGLNKKYIPAVCQYAQLLGQEKPLKALDILEQSWNDAQHPALLGTHNHIASRLLDNKAVKKFTAKDWRKRLANLYSKQLSDTAASQLAIAKAQAALADDDIAVVRSLLETQDKKNPEVLKLLAAVADHQEQQQQMLTDAETLSQPKLWDCHDCEQSSETWTAVCPNCGAIDSLRYRAV